MKGKKVAFQFSWGNYQAMETIENNIEALARENAWRKMSDVIEVSRANNIRTYHSLEDLEQDKERSRMFLREEPYAVFINGMEDAIAKSWATYAEIRALDMRGASNEKILELYERLHTDWQRVIVYFLATQSEGTHALIEEMQKHVSPEEVSILLWPDKLDVANQEAIDWYGIVQKPYLEERVYEHAYRYPWTVAAHFTYEDVLETLKARYDYDRDHTSSPTIAEEKKKTHERQQLILEKHPEIRGYARRAQRLVLSRMEIKAAYSGADFYFIPIVHEIARRSGESYLDINLYYLLKEGRDLILNKSALSPSIKNARRRCFVGAIEDGRVVYFEGEDAEDYARSRLGSLYEEEKIIEGDTLSGVTAVKGKVRGIVRILHANDVPRVRALRHSFQKGEILVTEMTQPNILDIAARAGAIVTDEGSLLSHAAIISREFGIPCIVYTKVATKALHDGDLVEVDAEKGIVKILERNKTPLVLSSLIF